MKRVSVIVCGMLIAFFCVHAPSVSFGQQVITVVASGSDTSEARALHDAMRRAVEKAVGTYISTKTTLRDNHLSKEIIVNSDATVTDYRILNKEENDGIWTVKIRAKVLPNEYLKYCPQTTSQKVSTLETGDVVNRRKTLRNASQTIRTVFKDHSLSLYRLKRTDRFKPSNDDDFNSDIATVTLDFEVRIDQKAYRKLQRHLCSLFDSLALQKTSRTFRKQRQQSSDDILNSFSQTMEKMKENAGSDNTAFIAFVETNTATVSCKLYLVPKRIFDILSDALNFGEKVIVCSATLKDRENTEKYLFEPRVFRFYEDRNDLLVFYNKFMLENCSGLSVRNQNFCFRTRGTLTMRMPAEYFDDDKIKDLKIYALFLNESCDHDKLIEIASEAEEKIFVNSSDPGPDEPGGSTDTDEFKKDEPSGEQASSGGCVWICPVCNGRKVMTKDVEVRRRCSSCGGRGSITRRSGSRSFDPHNFSAIASPSYYEEKCQNCSGQGFFTVRQSKTIRCPECSK